MSGYPNPFNVQTLPTENNGGGRRNRNWEEAVYFLNMYLPTEETRDDGSVVKMKLEAIKFRPSNANEMALLNFLQTGGDKAIEWLRQNIIFDLQSAEKKSKNAVTLKLGG